VAEATVGTGLLATCCLFDKPNMYAPAEESIKSRTTVVMIKNEFAPEELGVGVLEPGII
jgi:hypothetical protein